LSASSFYCIIMTVVVTVTHLIDVQETHEIQVIDERRRRFMELVRQQKTVCQLLVSVSICVVCLCMHILQ